MPPTPDHEFDARLLDLHLGHLSQAEQSALRREIDADPRLARQNDALRTVFTALQAAPEAALPAGLTERVKARVRAAGPAPRVVRATDDLTAAVERRNERVIRLGSLRDVVAVAALIVLAVGVGVPGMMHMRERSNRLGCSRNLQMIGAGLQQYASVFGSSLPFVGWGQDRSWRPSTAPDLVTVHNRRHVYPLLRLAYVRDPRVFVCPAQRGEPMSPNEVPWRDDFAENCNVTYGYQNMAGVRPSLNRDDPDMPIMADDNPIFADGLPLFDARRLQRLPWSDPEVGNSPAHGGAGQNILTLDGRVKWTTNPFVGVGGDNIWILRDVLDYTGREGPRASTDSHLLK